MVIKKIIITGANGFIGNYLVNFLRKNGHEVLPFLRKPDLDKGEFFYEINGVINESIVAASDILIHCAFIPKVKNGNAIEQNIVGTQKLIAACKKHKVKFIFFSTLSAHAAAESDYGKHKLLLESKLDLEIDAILKPGLVIGNGGLFGRMLAFSKKFRTVPLIDGGKQPLQFIALSDVAQSTQKIIENNLSGSFTLVSDEPMTYRQFYKTIGEAFGIRLLFVWIPVNIILFSLGLFDRMKIKIPVSKENLLGLKNMAFIDPGNGMERIGINPLKLKDTLENLKAKL